jgi:hypothetical protein
MAVGKVYWPVGGDGVERHSNVIRRTIGLYNSGYEYSFFASSLSTTVIVSWRCARPFPVRIPRLKRLELCDKGI